MSEINKIKRIQVDLLKLKPLENQKNVYDSYKNFLAQFFENGSPSEKYFERISCPICNNNNDNKLMKIDSFQYILCDNCGTIYNSPRLKKEFLEKMYSEGEYENYVKKLTLPGDKIRRNITELRKVRQVNSLFHTPGKILDVGCGAGVFLSIAAENGWNCTGIELSRVGITSAQDAGINIFEKSFDEFQIDNQFDCISFWGVLEHIVNPMEQLSKAVSLLKDQGVIVFEVPSADSLLMQYVLKYGLIPYRFIENARHLSFFSQKSIDQLGCKLHMDIEYIETNGFRYTNNSVYGIG